MRFLLDEGVPISTGKVLQAAGHEVIFFPESGLAKGSTDPVVCVAANANDAVLVAHDNDMKTLAIGHGITAAKFATLSLLRLNCRESVSAARVKVAMSLIEHEWAQGEGRERRLFVVIGDEVMRTHR